MIVTQRGTLVENNAVSDLVNTGGGAVKKRTRSATPAHQLAGGFSVSAQLLVEINGLGFCHREVEDKVEIAGQGAEITFREVDHRAAHAGLFQLLAF